MSETQVPEMTQQASGSTQEDSAGALLRQARERVGLHIAALAVSIRVPVKKIEALEADRLDLLPDAAFTRALASSVCRALKIDPAPVLERLPQTQSPRLMTDDAGMNVPFRGPGDMAHEPFWQQFPKPVIAGVLLLLLGALALMFFPDDEEEQAATKLVSSEVVQAAAPAPQPEPVPAPVPVIAVTPAAPQAAAVPAAPASATPPAPVPVAPPVAVAPPSVAPAPAAAPVAVAKPAAPPEAAKPAAPAAAGVLTLRTKAPSWVEVTDAQGVAQLRRIVAPGENVVGVSGALPLAVVVGRADATEVWIRGKTFALEGLTRENVARFEVK